MYLKRLFSFSVSTFKFKLRQTLRNGIATATATVKATPAAVVFTRLVQRSGARTDFIMERHRNDVVLTVVASRSSRISRRREHRRISILFYSNFKKYV